MDTDSPDRSVTAALLSALRPSRSVLLVFGLLVGLVLQYILRLPLDGFTPAWFETWLPFDVLDRLLSLVLAPVHRVLDALYDPWSPDFAFFGITLCYFYALAVVIGTLYDRVSPSE